MKRYLSSPRDWGRGTRTADMQQGMRAGADNRNQCGLTLRHRDMSRAAIYNLNITWALLLQSDINTGNNEAWLVTPRNTGLHHITIHIGDSVHWAPRALQSGYFHLFMLSEALKSVLTPGERQRWPSGLSGGVHKYVSQSINDDPYNKCGLLTLWEI